MDTNAPSWFYADDYQRKLLQCLFQHPDESRDVLERIDPNYFEALPMRWVARKMRWSIEKLGVPLTPTVLSTEAVRDTRHGLIRPEYIEAFASLIAELDDPVPDKTYILDRAIEFIRSVSLREFVIDVAQKLDGDKPIDWRKIDEALDIQRRIGVREDGGPPVDVLSQTDELIDEMVNYVPDGVPTGTMLDALMEPGGVPPQQLAVLAGASGLGKTSMLVHFAGSALLAGKNVLYVTLELSRKFIVRRFWSRFTDIDLNFLKQQPTKLRAKLAEVQQQAGGKLYVLQYSAGSLTIEKLRSAVRRLESYAVYPDVIFLDYADCMSLSEFTGWQGLGENDHGPLGRLYTGLRGLATDLHLPLWTASQVNRAGAMAENPNNTNLAGAYAKSFPADVVVALAQTAAEADANLARLCVLKNRNGPTNDAIKIEYIPSRVHVRDIGLQTAAELEDQIRRTGEMVRQKRAKREG